MKITPSTLLTFFLLLAGTIASAAAPVPPDCVGVGGAKNASTEFIRSRCAAVAMYPRLCFRSLAGYAGTVGHSDARLAHIAANLTHARLRPLSCRASALSRNPSSADLPVLRECAEVLASAADLAGQAAEELRGLERAIGPAAALRVSNAQTWMSAALTNEGTCSDDSVPPPAPAPAGAVSEVYCAVRKAEKYTSNALALIASLIN